LKQHRNTNQQRLRINSGIRAREVRVISEDGNLGVMSTEDAIKLAEEQGFDLIEISPQADPPVAKIMDYGKYQYDQKKKKREIKANATVSEVKNIQVKVGTGDQDLLMKAKKASEWLRDGHRIRAELYLRGRVKYMDKSFHHERLERFLTLLTEDYKVVEDFKQSPKGIAILIERDKSGKKSKQKAEGEESPQTSE
jgi:translation initiation factor IF-3